MKSERSEGMNQVEDMKKGQQTEQMQQRSQRTEQTQESQQMQPSQSWQNAQNSQNPQHSHQVGQLWTKQNTPKTGQLQAMLEQKPLSLIVSLPGNDLALAQAAREEGADALKVHFNVGHRASGNHFGSLDDYTEVFRAIRAEFGGPFGVVPSGVVPSGSIEGTRREDVERLAGMGFDFYSIYAHHLPSFMLQDLGLESTFAINDEYDVSLVASAAHFGFTALEASIVPGKEYGTPLSFADVLRYRRLVVQAGVPILVPSQRKLVPEDVPVLHHSGIKAIMLGAMVTGKTEDQLRRAVSSFRNAIDRLTGRDGS